MALSLTPRRAGNSNLAPATSSVALILESPRCGLEKELILPSDSITVRRSSSSASPLLQIHIDHDALHSRLGYGETGLLNKVPPRATLYYEISLVAIEQRRAEDDVPALALPSSTGGGDGAGEEDASVTTVVVVDGEPVKLDKLGPVVINKDGTASRITNWQEMTPVEQQKTLRIISKRNKARIAAIIEQQRTEHTNDL